MTTGGVLVVGDVIDDVVVRPELPIRPDTDTPSRIDRVAGGSAANTACWLAEAGVPTTLVATVGRDDAARHGALLAACGVVARLAVADGLPTGTIVILSQGDERAMLTDRGANALTGPAAVTDDLLAAHRLLHVTGHVLADPLRSAGWRDVLARARTHGCDVSIAPGSAGMLEDAPERFRRLVAGTRLLLAGEAEARLLTGEADAEAAARALGREHDLVAVTLGGRGALLVESGTVLQVPPHPSHAVDVTGAGDAFAAGLLAGLVRGLPLADAGRGAAALAARAVGQVGARPAGSAPIR